MGLIYGDIPLPGDSVGELTFPLQKSQDLLVCSRKREGEDAKEGAQPRGQIEAGWGPSWEGRVNASAKLGGLLEVRGSRPWINHSSCS